MVTPYPPLPSGATIVWLEWARQTGERIGSRVLDWMRQMFCGLHGHDNLLHFEKDRLSLQCSSCGYHSPGWEVGKAARPAVAVRRDARPFMLRVRLVGNRRVA